MSRRSAVTPGSGPPSRWIPLQGTWRAPAHQPSPKWGELTVSHELIHINHRLHCFNLHATRGGRCDRSVRLVGSWIFYTSHPFLHAHSQTAIPDPAGWDPHLLCWCALQTPALIPTLLGSHLFKFGPPPVHASHLRPLVKNNTFWINPLFPFSPPPFSPISPAPPTFIPAGYVSVIFCAADYD